MINYTQLLKKYDKKQKPERTSNEYWNKQRQEANRKNRHLLLDELLNEIPFHLNKDQIIQIRNWIDTFNPHWKEFHRQSKDKTILLALIMIQQKRANPRRKVTEYKISKKYQLTSAKFELIQNRLIFLQMKYTPITYTLSNKYNHEILNKGEQ